MIALTIHLEEKTEQDITNKLREIITDISIGDKKGNGWYVYDPHMDLMSKTPEEFQ